MDLVKKAYDSTPRHKLWSRLYHIGVRGEMLNAIAALYRDVKFSIKFADGLLPEFKADTGVRRGCPLSPVTFFLAYSLKCCMIISLIVAPRVTPTLQGYHVA